MEELMRHAGIVRQVVHRAMAGTETAGIRFEKGQRVFLMVGSANRDPAQFRDPGRDAPSFRPGRLRTAAATPASARC